jgi:hypothetical protein
MINGKWFATAEDWVLFFSIAVKCRQKNDINEARDWLHLHSHKNNLCLPSDQEVRSLIHEVATWLEKFDENWHDNLVSRG